MKLEERIEEILLNHEGVLTVDEITRALEEQGVTNDGGSDICFFQVHARTFNLHDMFDRDGNKVILKRMF